MHEGNRVREFYSRLPQPVLAGIETGVSMPWFLNLMEELEIDCRVGHPVQIRAAEPRKQKHDRRDAELILKLLAESRFPAIWLPSKELLDLLALPLHRHQWVRMRTRIRNLVEEIHSSAAKPSRQSEAEKRKHAQPASEEISLDALEQGCC